MCVCVCVCVRALVFFLQLLPSLRDTYMVAIKRVLHIAPPSDAECDLGEWLVALWDGNIIPEQLATLPIMSPRFGWTCQIIFALKHLVEWCIGLANRKRDWHSKWVLEMLDHDTMRPWIVKADSCSLLYLALA